MTTAACASRHGRSFYFKNIMNDDHYTPPYADDPKLMELRAKEKIITACGKASKIADDGEALSSLLAAHPQAEQLFSLDELRRLIRNWRVRREDFSAEVEIDFMQFTLRDQIRTRIEELCFEGNYRSFIEASPVKVSGVTGPGFLAALFPEGTSILTFNSSRAKEGLPWNVELDGDIGAWFWPLPVCDEVAEGKWVQKAKKSVAAWSSASANFDSESLDLMRDLIIARQIPVRAIISTLAGTIIIFAIDAHSEAEWRKKCRALKARIEALGASCPYFRYNWVAPMIHSNSTRLVYFCP